MSQRMGRARALVVAPEGAFRLFHLGPHGVQVVAGRNHWKQQNKCAAESAQENERVRRRTIGSGRRSPLPPEQPAGQQQGQPTEIKKKLHTKRPGSLERHHDLVELPQDKQDKWDSTEMASDLRTSSCFPRAAKSRYGPCAICKGWGVCNLWRRMAFLAGISAMASAWIT